VTSQILYAIYSDASISNISLSSSRTEILQPSQELTIPLSCGNSLQCGIPPQQNGSSVIYIPNKDNSSLILLEIENEMLYSYNITAPCVFNDFALLSNVDDFPLLIACNLTDDGNVRYVLSKLFGNVTRSGIELVPAIQAVVNPITLTMPINDEETDGGFVIISINTQNEVIIFRVQDLELDRYPLATDQPCVPVRIQKLRSNIFFLLTCEEGQYLVNISTRTVSFVSLPSLIRALTSNIRYSLTVSVSNSTTTVTIQEVLSQQTATRIIHLNTNVIYAADFGQDDKFAYVATDIGIVFINVAMALEGADQPTYTITIPVCSQCPPVVFLNDTIALASSSTGNNQFTLVQFFDLSSWPPLNPMNRTLSRQPKVYWYDQYIQPTPVPIATLSTMHTITPSPSSSFSSLNSLDVSSTGFIDGTMQHDELSGGAIAGISVGACLICFGLILTAVIITAFAVRHFGNRTRNEMPVCADENNNRDQLVSG